MIETHSLWSVLYLIMGEYCRRRTSQHDAALQTYTMQISAPQSSLNRYVLYSIELTNIWL